MSSKAIPASLFFSITHSGDYNLEESHRLERLSRVFSSSRKPSASQISAFSLSHTSLSSSPVSVRSSVVRDKHDLNWVSLEDYCAHWDKLDKASQDSICALVDSDLSSNRNRFGLKKLNLESHLLLNIGCDMTNIVNNGFSSVTTNLKYSDGSYDTKCVYNRTVEAKTNVRAYNAFNKEYSVER
jgi:hypothetical protein